MRRGGGVGYDFSAIRPRGARVRGTDSAASGPISYMHVFDQSCATVESAGARRGAQMGVLRCDHPGHHGVRRRQAAGGQAQQLQHLGRRDRRADARRSRPTAPSSSCTRPSPGRRRSPRGAHRRDDGLWVYATIRARELWQAIMRNTYEAAEPGVLFLDRINAENNLHYAERIEATNPCGEIPIPDHGCCCLGSINLTRFVRDPFGAEARFDMRGLRRDGGGGGAHARQRADRDGLAAARAGARGGGQAADRARLHRPRRRADHARAALRQRRGARRSRPT